LVFDHHPLFLCFVDKPDEEKTDKIRICDYMVITCPKNASDEIFDASVRLVLEDFEKADKHVIQVNTMLLWLLG